MAVIMGDVGGKVWGHSLRFWVLEMLLGMLVSFA